LLKDFIVKIWQEAVINWPPFFLHIISYRSRTPAVALTRLREIDQTFHAVWHVECFLLVRVFFTRTSVFYCQAFLILSQKKECISGKKVRRICQRELNC
jgi:hypothetical protein